MFELEEYKKIPGWFEEGTAEALDKLIKEHNVKTVIEVGSFLGRSTLFFAARVDRVYAIDRFTMWQEGREHGALQMANGKENFYEDFLWNIVHGLDKIVPLMGDSQTINRITSLANLKADLVFIDGSHDIDSVTQDIQLWLSHANKIFCGHDFGSDWPQVTIAVKDLVEGYLVAEHSSLWYKVL